MLAWLSEHQPVDLGDTIVDAGAFLGGSTAALTRGLRSAGRSNRVHSYDMFLAPNDAYSLSMIGNGRAAGTSVQDMFESNLADSLDLVEIRCGDFEKAVAPERIAILFVDVAKTWNLNAVVVQEFFPRLMPGRSIVVQQDHNTHSCPWVNLTMEVYADYFDLLCDQDGSRVYLYKRAIPYREMQIDLRSLPLRFKLAALAISARRAPHPITRFMSSVSAAWLIFEHRGLEQAEEYLMSISPLQPWISEMPYADDVLRSMKIHGTESGVAEYERNYFRA